MVGSVNNMLGPRTLGPSSLVLSYSKAIPLSLRSNVRELSKLHTPPESRMQGHASRLMQKTCEEADQAGLVLMLMPESEALADWYLRFGFRMIQRGPMVMARQKGAQPMFKLKAE